jgi:malonyl-ACP O-methyltransferase BioC
MSGRKARIVQAFSSRAPTYDAAASVQERVAQRLAERIAATIAGPATGAPPRRILEIGCGTGFLSAHLARIFPDSDLLLTDLSPAMLERCRSRLGGRPRYQLLDGERPDELVGEFDLIASSLAFQWFGDLRGGLTRLGGLLAPGAELQFATLGERTFVEWRQAHTELGLLCGTPAYPRADAFPWPAGFAHALDAELHSDVHDNGRDFVRSLKRLGAQEPAAGHRPLAPGSFRRLLRSLQDGFSATYHVLYGRMRH